MKTPRNVKKLLSIVLSAAMILTGINVAPDRAKAGKTAGKTAVSSKKGESQVAPPEWPGLELAEEITQMKLVFESSEPIASYHYGVLTMPGDEIKKTPTEGHEYVYEATMSLTNVGYLTDLGWVEYDPSLEGQDVELSLDGISLTVGDKTCSMTMVNASYIDYSGSISSENDYGLAFCGLGKDIDPVDGALIASDVDTDPVLSRLICRKELTDESTLKEGSGFYLLVGNVEKTELTDAVLCSERTGEKVTAEDLKIGLPLIMKVSDSEGQAVDPLGFNWHLSYKNDADEWELIDGRCGNNPIKIPPEACGHKLKAEATVSANAISDDPDGFIYRDRYYMSGGSLSDTTEDTVTKSKIDRVVLFTDYQGEDELTEDTLKVGKDIYARAYDAVGNPVDLSYTNVQWSYTKDEVEQTIESVDFSDYSYCTMPKAAFRSPIKVSVMPSSDEAYTNTVSVTVESEYPVGKDRITKVEIVEDAINDGTLEIEWTCDEETNRNDVATLSSKMNLTFYAVDEDDTETKVEGTPELKDFVGKRIKVVATAKGDADYDVDGTLTDTTETVVQKLTAESVKIDQDAYDPPIYVGDNLHLTLLDSNGEEIYPWKEILHLGSREKLYKYKWYYGSGEDWTEILGEDNYNLEKIPSAAAGKKIKVEVRLSEHAPAALYAVKDGKITYQTEKTVKLHKLTKARLSFDGYPNGLKNGNSIEAKCYEDEDDTEGYSYEYLCYLDFTWYVTESGDPGDRVKVAQDYYIWNITSGDGHAGKHIQVVISVKDDYKEYFDEASKTKTLTLTTDAIIAGEEPETSVLKKLQWKINNQDCDVLEKLQVGDPLSVMAYDQYGARLDRYNIIWKWSYGEGDDWTICTDNTSPDIYITAEMIGKKLKVEAVDVNEGVELTIPGEGIGRTTDVVVEKFIVDSVAFEETVMQNGLVVGHRIWTDVKTADGKNIAYISDENDKKYLRYVWYVEDGSGWKKIQGESDYYYSLDMDCLGKRIKVEVSSTDDTVVEIPAGKGVYISEKAVSPYTVGEIYLDCEPLREGMELTARIYDDYGDSHYLAYIPSELLDYRWYTVDEHGTEVLIASTGTDKKDSILLTDNEVGKKIKLVITSLDENKVKPGKSMTKTTEDAVQGASFSKVEFEYANTDEICEVGDCLRIVLYDGSDNPYSDDQYYYVKYIWTYQNDQGETVTIDTEGSEPGREITVPKEAIGKSIHVKAIYKGSKDEPAEGAATIEADSHVVQKKQIKRLEISGPVGAAEIKTGQWIYINALDRYDRSIDLLADGDFWFTWSYGEAGSKSKDTPEGVGGWTVVPEAIGAPVTAKINLKADSGFTLAEDLVNPVTTTSSVAKLKLDKLSFSTKPFGKETPSYKIGERIFVRAVEQSEDEYGETMEYHIPSELLTCQWYYITSGGVEKPIVEEGEDASDDSLIIPAEAIGCRLKVRVAAENESMLTVPEDKKTFVSDTMVQKMVLTLKAGLETRILIGNYIGYEAYDEDEDWITDGIKYTWYVNGTEVENEDSSAYDLKVLPEYAGKVISVKVELDENAAKIYSIDSEALTYSFGKAEKAKLSDIRLRNSNAAGLIKTGANESLSADIYREDGTALDNGEGVIYTWYYGDKDSWTKFPSDASGNDYMPTSIPHEAAGSYIKVEFSIDDADRFELAEGAVRSAITSERVRIPVLTSVAFTSQKLEAFTAATVQVKDSDAAVVDDCCTYEWYYGDDKASLHKIEGATGATLELIPKEAIGHKLYVEVTADDSTVMNPTDEGGAIVKKSVWSTSNVTAPQVTKADLSATENLKIGQQLKVTAKTSNNIIVSEEQLAYQWYLGEEAEDAAIKWTTLSEETGSSYTISKDAAGKYVRVTVKAKNPEKLNVAEGLEAKTTESVQQRTLDKVKLYADSYRVGSKVKAMMTDTNGENITDTDALQIKWYLLDDGEEKNLLEDETSDELVIPSVAVGKKLYIEVTPKEHSEIAGEMVKDTADRKVTSSLADKVTLESGSSDGKVRVGSELKAVVKESIGNIISGASENLEYKWYYGEKDNETQELLAGASSGDKITVPQEALGKYIKVSVTAKEGGVIEVSGGKLTAGTSMAVEKAESTPVPEDQESSSPKPEDQESSSPKPEDQESSSPKPGDGKTSPTPGGGQSTSTPKPTGGSGGGQSTSTPKPTGGSGGGQSTSTPKPTGSSGQSTSTPKPTGGSGGGQSMSTPKPTDDPSATKQPDASAAPTDPSATSEPDASAAPADPNATSEPDVSGTPADPGATNLPGTSGTNPSPAENTNQPGTTVPDGSGASPGTDANQSGSGATATPQPTTKDKEKSTKDNKTQLKAVKIKKAVSRKGGKVYLTFAKVSGAKKYQIRYSTDKSMKTMVVQATTKRTSILIKKLKKQKTYYFQVRAVDSSGKKGEWSAGKKVTIK